jgi:hypothetical protein
MTGRRVLVVWIALVAVIVIAIAAGLLLFWASTNRLHRRTTAFSRLPWWRRHWDTTYEPLGRALPARDAESV